MERLYRNNASFKSTIAVSLSKSKVRLLVSSRVFKSVLSQLIQDKSALFKFDEMKGFLETQIKLKEEIWRYCSGYCFN